MFYRAPLAVAPFREIKKEVKAAKKKFLEEHPGHKSHIVLDFRHLREERITPK